jgi:hypothetical protein
MDQIAMVEKDVSGHRPATLLQADRVPGEAGINEYNRLSC